MTDGEMLKELRNLAATEGGLKTSSAIRLICSAQADMLEMIGNLQGNFGSHVGSQSNQVKESEVSITALSQEVGKVRESLTDIKAKIDLMCTNPVIKVGTFIKSNPKLSFFILVLILVLSNLWFIEEFRSAILGWVGVPSGIIGLFNHVSAITPIP